MRRTLPLIVALSALFATAAGALAANGGGPTATVSAGGAGFNVPSKRLEAAFKTALYHRAGSPIGCYETPKTLANLIRKAHGFKTGVAPTIKKIRKPLVVYMVKRGTKCGNVRMAFRHKPTGVWVLNSSPGTLVVNGRGNRRLNDLTRFGQRGPLRAIRFATKTFRLTRPDLPERFDVICPGKTFPLGGGMKTTPGLGPDGEGAYPHSSERLGVQRGWHVNPFLLDPGYNGVTPRKITMQVICGLGLIPTSAPHKTVFTLPGETKTAVARCPKGQYLLSGGYQRTDFVSHGGNYIFESRAVGNRAWRASARAFGAFGGELSTVAYCLKHRRPLLKQVSASVPLPSGQSATATTPRCPRGRILSVGGFSSNGSDKIFIGDAGFNRKQGTWSTTGYGFFGGATSLTAYGYCLRD